MFPHMCANVNRMLHSRADKNNDLVLFSYQVLAGRFWFIFSPLSHARFTTNSKNKHGNGIKKRKPTASLSFFLSIWTKTNFYQSFSCLSVLNRKKTTVYYNTGCM